MRRLIMLLCLIALVIVSAQQGAALAQGGTTPTLLNEFRINDSKNVKLPSIASTGTTIHVAGGANELDALYWNKADTATAFGAGLRVGAAEGQPDYDTASVSAGPNNSIYYAWINQKSRQILLRQRTSDGAFGPQRTVVSSDFAFFPQVVAAADGAIYVAWQEVDKPLYLRRSTDGGASWSSTIRISTKNTFSVPPRLAAGPNGEVGIAYTDVDLRVWVGLWNGSGFTSESITGAGSSGNPSLTFTKAGKAYAAWRGVDDSGANAGAFYAERQGAGTWTTARLTEGKVYGTVYIVADSSDTLHVALVAQPAGSPRVYYTYKQSGQAFANLVGANATPVFNTSLTITLSDKAYAHVASEKFDGDVPYTYYARFSGPASSNVNAQPSIEEGAAQIGRKTTVQVSFTDVRGSPTQLLWRWGSAPSESANDSSGWQSFVNPISIPVPDALLDSATCSPVRLYTLARDASQVVESSAKFDEIVIDSSVTAAVAISNPHLLRKSSQFSDAQVNARLGDLSQDGGASDGDAGYTREPIFYLNLQGQNECSGIKDVAAGRSTTTIAPAITVTKDFYANVLPAPGQFSAGENTVLARVSDNAGNFRDYSTTLIYDTSAPVLSSSAPGTLSATVNPNITVLTSLSLSNVSVTDNAYPGGFWGVWVANSRTDVADPVASTGLNWIPVQAPSSGSSFVIDGWSLSYGLPTDQVTTGSYFIYVRFLDGAGNPTSGYLKTSVSIDKVSRSANYIPMIDR